MLNVRFSILVTLTAGVLISCATTYRYGAPYDSENVTKIVVGKTSEQDVRHFFGKPLKTGLVNGHTVYTYCYEEIVFNQDDSVERNGNTLVIEFDENKVVLNYYFNAPGNEVPLTHMIVNEHNSSKRQQEQVAWQNQAAVIQDP